MADQKDYSNPLLDNKEAFQRLFNNILEFVNNGDYTAQTRENIKDGLSLGKTFLEAKLEKGSIENQKDLMEARRAFFESEKIRLEVESMVIDNAIKKLEAVLKMCELKRKLITEEPTDNLLR